MPCIFGCAAPHKGAFAERALRGFSCGSPALCRFCLEDITAKSQPGYSKSTVLYLSGVDKSMFPPGRGENTALILLEKALLRKILCRQTEGDLLRLPKVRGRVPGEAGSLALADA